MDKKGVRNLPLKYIVITIIIVILLSIVLEFFDIIKFGILHTVNSTILNPPRL
jgi:hypothetical protein